MLKIESVVNKDEIAYAITTTDLGIIAMLKDTLEKRIELREKILKSERADEKLKKLASADIEKYKKYLEEF